MLTEKDKKKKKKKKKKGSRDTQVNPLGHGMVTNKIRRSSIFSTVSPSAETPWYLTFIITLSYMLFSELN
jgi:hypothetical protein